MACQVCSVCGGHPHLPRTRRAAIETLFRATVHAALRSLIEDAQGSRAVPKSEQVSTFAFYSCDKHMTKSILEKKGHLNHTSWVTAHDKSPGRSSKLEPRGRNCGSQVHQLSPVACSARSLFSYTPTTTFLGIIHHGIALPAQSLIKKVSQRFVHKKVDGGISQ